MRLTAPKSKHQPLSSADLGEILNNYSLEFDEICPEHNIQGSPERVEFRLVLKDTNNQLYLLEEINSNHLKQKQIIAKTLELFTLQQTPYVFSYLKTTQQSHHLFYNNRYYQLSRYLQGTTLLRPLYLSEGWRGEKVAYFLCCLKKTAEKLKTSLNQEHFDLSAYLHTTLHQMKHHHPTIASQIEPITTYLQHTTLPALNKLPHTFSHGDLHPLNIIWEDKDIKAVIDWEFCSYKTELYDPANLLGCLGIEHPSGLLDNFSTRFLSILKESGIHSEKSYRHLIDLIILLRIAWLTEWIKKHDADMIDLELDYMNLLFKNKDYLLDQLDIKKVADL